MTARSEEGFENVPKALGRSGSKVRGAGAVMNTGQLFQGTLWGTVQSGYCENTLFRKAIKIKKNSSVNIKYIFTDENWVFPGMEPTPLERKK